MPKKVMMFINFYLIWMTTTTTVTIKSSKFVLNNYFYALPKKERESKKHVPVKQKLENIFSCRCLRHAKQIKGRGRKPVAAGTKLMKPIIYCKKMK
jgi:hypothetical protein